MAKKTTQLQIRVAPAQKAALRKHARAAGLDVSSYVLARALPAGASRLAQIVRELEDDRDRPAALAHLNDFLVSLTSAELTDAVDAADVSRLSEFVRNYVAAMVEHACAQKGRAPPRWTSAVEPLPEPWFAGSLEALRPHLLRASPVAFKRRNLFIDSTLGARI